MIPIERFSHYFNRILIDCGYPYYCIYDQNNRNNIRFFSNSARLVNNLESIYDPLIFNFKYTISSKNIDKLLEHFNSRSNLVIQYDKPYVGYFYLNSSEKPNSEIDFIYEIINDTITFIINGGLYKIFLLTMLICESNVISKGENKFVIGDSILSNFGRSRIEDYLYDVKNDSIEYVCFFNNSSDEGEFRSLEEKDIRFDRDKKIDNILK